MKTNTDALPKEVAEIAEAFGIRGKDLTNVFNGVQLAREALESGIPAEVALGIAETVEISAPALSSISVQAYKAYLEMARASGLDPEEKPRRRNPFIELDEEEKRQGFSATADPFTEREHDDPRAKDANFAAEYCRCLNPDEDDEPNEEEGPYQRGRRAAADAEEERVDGPHYNDPILDERQTQYGTFADNARTANTIASALLGDTVEWDKFEDDQYAALYMIAMKMARLANGDPNHIDGWRDIAGYATLVADRLAEDETR